MVLARDFLGNPATVASMKGNLKGNGIAATKDLSFAAEEAGAFKASLQGLGLTLGTYQCVQRPCLNSCWYQGDTGSR